MRRKIVFQKLVNWYPGYSLCTLCDVFQWMLATGWNYSKDGSGVYELLYGFSGLGAQDYNYGYGFKSPDIYREIKQAFVRAIVAQDVGEVVNAWRKQERIALGNYRMLPVSETFITPREIYELFWYSGKILTTQLNPYHADAVEIIDVRLSPNHQGWMAILNYGVDGSGWDYDLLPERMKFSEAVICAKARMAELTMQEPTP